ncbi:hypothetical protein D3C81_1548990 [compost metagenome]
MLQHRQRGHLYPHDLHFARADLVNAGKKLHQRSFAGAGWAQKAKGFRLIYLKVNIPKHLLAAKSSADMGYGNNRSVLIHVDLLDSHHYE